MTRIAPTHTRTWVTPATTRPDAVMPPGSSTLHAIGDVHIGGSNVNRRDVVTADLASPNLPTPAARIQVGDLVNNGLASEDVSAQTWLTAMDPNTHLLCGNHDIWQNVRTADQWAAAYGLADQNYAVDLPFGVRLLVVGPDTMPTNDTRIELSAATTTWLDAQLGSTALPCFIACHAPLASTVGGDTAANWTSFLADYAASPDATILSVLGAHANAKAWISGHTHSDITMPDIVCGRTVGSHTIACINASALFYTGNTVDFFDRICTAYITYLGNRIDVRYRNHGSRSWAAPNGARVLSVAL